MSRQPGPRPAARRRASVVAAALLSLLLVLTAGCSTAEPRDIRGIQPDPIRPAAAHLAEAEEMIRQIVDAVSPGATITSHDIVAWEQCTAPLEGQVYKNITRIFDAPPGQTGADLIPALQQQFRDRGFTLPATSHDDRGTFIVFTGSTTRLGFAVLADKDTPTVQVNVATQCGSPPPDDTDT